MRILSLKSAWLLFARQIVRDVAKHKVLAALNIGSVALGIAVFLAIQIAMHSANRSFSAGIDLVAGKSHLEIRGDIPEEIFPTISKNPDSRACTPLVEGYLSLPGKPGEYLQLLGVDVFTNAEFRTLEMGTQFDPTKWLSEPYTVALTRPFAERNGLKIGDRLRVVVNARVKEVKVGWLFDPDDSPASTNSRFAVMDIGWAQELLGMRGRLTSIQIILKKPERAERVAAQLQGSLPAGLRVAPPGQRSFQVQKMLSAFELNLTALSMVSLLVGMFLIYNTISASVARRTSEIGILRALGASRLQVRWLFLGQALLFCATGVALGSVLGVTLAQGLLGLISKTISSLYVALSIDRSFLNPLHFLAAMVVGAATGLAGAWIPAQEAANLDPIAAISLEKRQTTKAQHSGFWTLAAAGGFALALLCGVLALAGISPWFSFGSAFFALLGSAALAPVATVCAGKCLGLIFRRLPLLRMAADNLWRSLRRNAMTVAALSTAVAMMTAVAVMIFSFRGTVNDWISSGMTADLFVTPAANELANVSAYVPEEVFGILREIPEVETSETFRETKVDFALEKGGALRQSALAVVGGNVRRNFQFAGGNNEQKARELSSGSPVVAVTESFARKSGVRQGQMLFIESPNGTVSVRIVGVYRDYSRDSGMIMMHAPLFLEHWKDPRVQSVAVHLRNGLALPRVAELIRSRLGALGEFAIYSNRELKERVLHIFDQTFAVTHALRVIAVVVAVAGLFLSLITLVVERRREIGLLRSLGASPLQIRSLFLTEAGLLAALASCLGVLGGMALAWVLTAVVNPAFFGWTIALQFPVVGLALTPLWMTLVALPAAWWPAVVAGRTPIASAVRSE